MARPTKYRKEYCDKIIEYFDVPPQRTEYRRTFYADGMLKSEEPVTKPAVFPTFQGFANLIGVNITTLHEWRRNYPEFSQAFARAKQIQESIWIANGMSGDYNPQFAKFFGINCFDGYKDKVETELTGVKFTFSSSDGPEEEISG